MDVVGSLKSEVFRPALMLLIPGLVAGAPFLFVLLTYQPAVLDFADSHATLSTFLSFVASAVFGMITYDLGSHIEVSFIDRRLKRKSNSTIVEDWYRYLRSYLPDRLVAYNYIHDRVLFLHFELGMTAALPFCAVGTTWAWFVRCDFPTTWFIYSIAGLFFATFFFLYEACSTAQMLADLRKELLKGFGSPAS